MFYTLCASVDSNTQHKDTLNAYICPLGLHCSPWCAHKKDKLLCWIRVMAQLVQCLVSETGYSKWVEKKNIRKRHLKTGRLIAVAAGLNRQRPVVDVLLVISQSSTAFQRRRTPPASGTLIWTQFGLGIKRVNRKI